MQYRKLQAALVERPEAGILSISYLQQGGGRHTFQRAMTTGKTAGVPEPRSRGFARSVLDPPLTAGTTGCGDVRCNPVHGVSRRRA